MKTITSKLLLKTLERISTSFLVANDQK